MTNLVLSFQDIIFNLQKFWSEKGCCIVQGHSLEMGAGTFHPATVMKSLGSKPWNVAYVQPSIRPTDSRFGAHPNRLQHYYQFQVILKPSPDNIQELYLKSIARLGIDSKINDIRFVEDDWKSPTLGAAGLGWEVWCNGMEISQFTYMQQIGNIDCLSVPGEITYGLERLALYIQEVDKFADIIWEKENNLTYADIDFTAEKQFSEYNINYSNHDMLLRHFDELEEECKRLIQKNLPLVAYDFCIKASHLFNLLDAKGIISIFMRASYILRIKNIVKSCCNKWLQMEKNNG